MNIQAGTLHRFGHVRQPRDELIVPDRGGDHPLLRPHRSKLGNQQTGLAAGPFDQKIDIAIGHLPLGAVQTHIERRENYAVFHLQ